MKKLLLLISILFSFYVNAQTSVYHPFPDSNATWCCQKGYTTGCCLCGTPEYQYRVTYQLNGHVSINNILYNRLLKYEILDTLCPTPGRSIDTTTIYIRQDTSLKKVWMYEAATNSDTILFDFNLQIGDTLDATKEFWAGYSHLADFWIVTSIDSILINGQYRKRFNYTPSFDSTCTSSMIEGIGSNHGLMYAPSNCFEYGATLHKFFQDNQLQYGDSSPVWFACHDFTLNISEPTNNFFANIFPNPFDLNARLQMNGTFQNAELKIYNSLGQQIRQQSIINKSTLINRDNLNNGIYFFQVTTSNGQMAIGKFLIE
jgi:hypothetical protein